MKNLFEKTLFILGVFVKVTVSPTQRFLQGTKKMGVRVFTFGVYAITFTVNTTREAVIAQAPYSFRPFLQELLTWKGLTGLAINFLTFFYVNYLLMAALRPIWPEKIVLTAIAYILGGLAEYLFRRVLGTREPLRLYLQRWMAGAMVFGALYCSLELLHPTSNLWIAKGYSALAAIFGVATEVAAMRWMARRNKKRQKS